MSPAPQMGNESRGGHWPLKAFWLLLLPLVLAGVALLLVVFGSSSFIFAAAYTIGWPATLFSVLTVKMLTDLLGFSWETGVICFHSVWFLTTMLGYSCFFLPAYKYAVTRRRTYLHTQIAWVVLFFLGAAVFACIIHGQVRGI